MRSKVDFLISRKVFSLVETTPEGINLVGYKWMFVRKRCKFKNVSWYKTRLVA